MAPLSPAGIIAALAIMPPVGEFRVETSGCAGPEGQSVRYPADRRAPPEAAGNLGGPGLGVGEIRAFPLAASPCGLPVNARAFSLNATVVPDTLLGYLTLWPAGQPQPLVSTLNALDDRIVANAAIVPAGPSGVVSSYVTSKTHFILDTNAYFAQ